MISFDKFIDTDFGVELIHKTENEALFVAKRKFYWHFVGVKLTSENGFIHNVLVQQHIPRYVMCEVIDSLKKIDHIAQDQAKAGRVTRTHECERVGIYSVGNSRYGFDLIYVHQGLSKEFCEYLEEDLVAFEVAKSKVKFVDDLYVLPRSKSYSKKPVSAKSKRLIEAIAFERVTCKKLDARNFGIYSAFCTWKDFCEEGIKDRHFYEALVDGQYKYDAEEFYYGDFMDLALNVQNDFLDKPIWGKGIKVDRDVAVDILVKGMSQLTSIQLTQFSLMMGMHESGLFLSLAQVLGLNSYEKYIEWKTQSYQPDSEYEQDLRYEIEIIKLLGELGKDID